MSASWAQSPFICVSLSPEPCADNYSHPLAWAPSHWGCLSVRAQAWGIIVRTISHQAQQGQAPCSISLLIPAHLSFPSATYLLLPSSPPTPAVLDFTLGLTFISRTTIHFQFCRVVGWMAIDDSILGMQLESPFGIDSAAVVVHGRARCLFCFPLCPTPPPPAISALVGWLQPISLPVWRHG